jgi:hypothetical protein
MGIIGSVVAVDLRATVFSNPRSEIAGYLVTKPS